MSAVNRVIYNITLSKHVCSPDSLAALESSSRALYVWALCRCPGTVVEIKKTVLKELYAKCKGKRLKEEEYGETSTGEST